MSMRILNFDDGFSSGSNPTEASFTTISLGGGYLYLCGDADTDGSVRFSATSGVAILESRSGGVWSTMETFTQ